MNCVNCGSQLPPEAMRCGFCGAAQPAAGQPVEARPPEAQPLAAQSAPSPAPEMTGGPAPYPNYGSYQQQQGGPQYGAPTGYQPQKKKAPKLLWVILALVAVLAVAVAGVFFFVYTTQSPKLQVLEAIVNTQQTLGEEAATAREQLGLAEWQRLLREETLEAEYQFGTGLPGGAGQVTAGGGMFLSLPEEKLELEADLGLAGTSLLQMQAWLDGDLAALSMPAVFDETYGVRTETLGRDYRGSALEELLGLEVDEELSFNLFEVLHLLAGEQTEDGQNSELMQEMLPALTDLWEAAEVEKAGKADTRVNGQTLECVNYRVTLPKDALLNCLDRLLAQLFEDGDLRGIMQETVDDLRAEMTGDAVCEVAVHDKQAVRFQLELPSAEAMRVTAEVGAATALSDALFLQVDKGQAVWLQASATGHHLPADGLFTTRLALAANFTGTLETLAELDLSYDSSAELDNFSMDVLLPGVEMALSAAGSLAVQPQAGQLEADFYDIKLTSGGVATDFSLQFAARPAAGHSFAPVNAQMLLEMDEAELEGLRRKWELFQTLMQFI